MNAATTLWGLQLCSAAYLITLGIFINVNDGNIFLGKLLFKVLPFWLGLGLFIFCVAEYMHWPILG